MEIMESIKDIFKVIAEIINMIGILILIYGFGKLLLKYLKIEFLTHPFKTSIKKIQKVRGEIGVYILLALDFLVASDIINTIMEITEEELIQLSVMIALRIAMGYFLGKEVEEIRNEKE